MQVTVFSANAVGEREARDAAQEEGVDSEIVAKDGRNASVLWGLQMAQRGVSNVALVKIPISGFLNFKYSLYFLFSISD